VAARGEARDGADYEAEVGYVAKGDQGAVIV